MGTTTLVLGGGIGGLVTASELARRLGDEHRVVLVERAEHHVFSPSLLWLMTGRRRPAEISRPLSRLGQRGVEVVRAEVERIDPASRQVVAGGRTLSADHVVIALGAELAPEAVPGLAEGGQTFYTVEGAQALHEAMVRFSGGRLAVLTAAPSYKCPAAPYEAAMILESECRRRRFRGQVQIDFYAAEAGPMGVAGPEISKAVRGMIEAKGIVYHPDHQVQEVDPSGRRLDFANGTTAAFDLLAYVPPHRAPRVVREAGLGDEGGWVGVDRHTMQTRFPGVYAVGDVTAIPLGMGKPLPKAGVFAHAQGQVVARNIAAAVRGRGTRTRFDGWGECFVEAGDGKAGLGRGDFYAEPSPQVRLYAPQWHWRAAKVLFEKWWLWRWF